MAFDASKNPLQVPSPSYTIKNIPLYLLFPELHIALRLDYLVTDIQTLRTGCDSSQTF